MSPRRMAAALLLTLAGAGPAALAQSTTAGPPAGSAAVGSAAAATSSAAPQPKPAPEPPNTEPEPSGGGGDPQAKEAPQADTEGKQVQATEPEGEAEAARVDGSCDGKWFTRVYQASYKSVVRIDTGGGLGAGFVFHSLKHVATAFHVVSLGREIEVTFADGKTSGATVVAVDKDNDLAILELDTPAVGVTPLEPDEEKKIELGTPVLAIGHPYATVGDELEGLLSWSVSQGIISGRGERLLQTDAALNPGNSGGPLIGCDGRVLGVVSAKLQAEGIGFVIPSRLLVKTLDKIGTQPEFGGDWRLSAMVGLLFHGNPEEGLLGFELGIGITFYDALQIRLRYGPLWSVSEEDQPPEVFQRSRMRHSLQGDLGYRLLLQERPFPIYMGAFIGGAAAKNETEITTLTGVATDPACTGGDCQVQVQRTDTDDDEWRGYPLIGLEIDLLGGVSLSYAFMPDVTDLRLSLHRGMLAFSL